MILIHPDDVVIPENRIRREFDEKKLKELRESILRNGLINPITVERRDDDKFTLRAGERRFRVLSGIIKEGGQFRLGNTASTGGLIPAIEFGTLDELQRLEIEVEENVVRADFTWQERDKALAALHELRKRQNPAQTLTATATEVLGKPAVGGHVSAVADALVTAKHMDNPEVAKAKTQKDALKVIRKLAEAKHREQVAKTFDITKTPHAILKGETDELLLGVPDRSIDVIVTDPPYGVGADNFGSMASTGHEYEDSYKYWKEIMEWFPDQLDRVAKERAHAYIFCDPRRFDELATLMVLANWTVFPTPLIWYKGNGMLPFPEHGPRRVYEAILYAWRGDRKVLLTGKPDLIHVTPVKDLRVGAQKPVALYQDLLGRSARAGDTVLDCFGGSGPVLVAANRMRLVATYIERNPDAYNIALSRANISDIDDGGVEQDGLEDVSV